MAVFAVYAPDGDLTVTETAARVEFVKEGFVWTAFLLPPVYLLVHRVWLGFLAYVIGLVLVNVLGWALGAPEWAAVLAGLAYSALIGLEAPGLRQWSLERKGLRHAASVVAPDREIAEHRFFAAVVGRGAVRPAPNSPGPVSAPGPLLFPGVEQAR